MIINFEKINDTVIKNFHGGEKNFDAKINVDEMNKIVYGKLEAGASIGVHTHSTNSEVMYFISGSGKIIYDDKYLEISKGLCHYCPKGHKHSIINNGNDDLVFFAVIPEQ